MARIMLSKAAIMGTSSADLFTVPSGERYVVTHIRLLNASGGVVVGTVNFNFVSGAGVVQGIDVSLSSNTTSGSMYDYWGRTAFEATDKLAYIADTVAAVHLVVDYERVILG